MDNSEAITEGFEPKPVTRSFSADSSADRTPDDFNHAVEDLSDQLKNVGLGEVEKEQREVMMSISESNGGVDSKATDFIQKEEEDGDGRSESEIRAQKSEVLYPVRPGAEDCSFYMRNGCCKFGSACKFNHPLPRKIQIARNEVREKEENVDKLQLIDCKYYVTAGGCKYGETCRFNHAKPQTFQASVPEFNFLGLPIRPGKIECPYYMRHGSCKFGPECKFNHPDPTSTGGTDSPSFNGNNGASIGSFSQKSTFQASSTSWNSPRQANSTAPYIPVMLSQTRGVSSQTPEWNGYQASGYPSSTYHMNNSSAETTIFSQYQHQAPPEEFPDRPDQPECSYFLKTGDCKFKFNCKYHHPKNRLPKQPHYALNDKGLPLRPDQNICTHYSRYGICKFGPACRFDHSTQLTYSARSSQAVVETPQVSANGNESDGWN